ncbi:hypothetical protein E2C01_035625 [Portunus trituberculatus]|uniref:Uncharacterized protein n=1 Tax=Portunus trituberculatus TaxID=210409 RepID=A0A5B7FA96_PORTR|nr:hypothetical protein [Portunus trituberculatus]
MRMAACQLDSCAPNSEISRCSCLFIRLSLENLVHAVPHVAQGAGSSHPGLLRLLPTPSVDGRRKESGLEGHAKG